MFGLCEACVSSVWLFLPLPPVDASYAVPGGARAVGPRRAGKHARIHTHFITLRFDRTQTGPSCSNVLKVDTVNHCCRKMISLKRNDTV